MIETITNSSNFITKCNHKESIKVVSEDFDEKVLNFKNNPSNLIIVTDFDYTLTKKYMEDDHLFSSYCVLERSDYVSSEFQKKNQEIFHKYSKFEHDPEIEFEVKDKLMQSWWKENLDLILSENLTKDNFSSMIIQSETKFLFRHGILELFELIERNKIPIYITSGGIVEIIEEALKLVIPQYSRLKELSLINVIANKFTYDEGDKIIGYEEPFVYTFNKGETLKRIFKSTGKGNIIVMGDHINDTDAVRHIDYESELKIGFINFHEDSENEQHSKLKEIYHLRYDACIYNDGNLLFVNKLIKEILGEISD